MAKEKATKTVGTDKSEKRHCRPQWHKLKSSMVRVR